MNSMIGFFSLAAELKPHFMQMSQWSLILQGHPAVHFGEYPFGRPKIP